MRLSIPVLFALIVFLFQIVPASAQYADNIENMVIWPPACTAGPGMKCPSLFESSLNALAAPIYKSDIVLVGKIVDAKKILEQNKTEYSIEVDKYIKTPKSYGMITAIGDGVSKKEFDNFNEVTYYNTPIFEKGNGVFVYLNQENGTYEISPYSFAISKNLPTGLPPENTWLTVDRSEYRYGDTVTISGLVKKAYIFESSLKNQDSFVYLTVRNPDNQVYENKTLDVDSDGAFNHSFKIKGRLGIDGQYGYDVRTGGTTWSNVFSYDSGHVQPPLQQIKSGVKFHNVQCSDGLELVYKKGDDTSACVTLETKIELTLRGWAEDNRVLLGCIGERQYMCYPEDMGAYRHALKRYYGVQICTPEYPTITISSPDHDPSPSTIILKIGVNNTTCWTNESNEPVTLTSEDGRWSSGIIYPDDSKFIQFNNTAFYKYIGQPQTAINGRIAIISDQTESLPILEKLQIAREIIKTDMGNPIVGIGVGSADNVLDITIHEDELKKNPNAEEYYKKRYQDMIPFDVPIRIDFGGWITPN